MAETPEIRTSPLAEPFGEIMAYLDQGEQIIAALRADPSDNVAVERVLELLKDLRDSHQAVIDLKKLSVKIRYAAIAAVYGADARVRVADIAEAAGVGDSMVSRISHDHGVAKRTNRPPTVREPEDAAGR